MMSVDSKGDSYDCINAMAETINGLYKSELIYNERMGPWRTVEDVELATLSWVHKFNTKRILFPIGGISPVEFEQRWHQANISATLTSDESAAIDEGGMITLAETPSDDAVAGLTQ